MPTKLQRIGIYLSRDEKKAIEKNAEKYGLTVSKFLTFVGSSDNNEPPPTADERKIIFDLYYQIEKAGNNLNQVAKALNVSRIANTQPPTQQRIEEAVTALTAVLKKLDSLF
jgi:hypothetical protein